MGEVKMKKTVQGAVCSISSSAVDASYDLEGRWHGALNEAERRAVKAWVKKLSVWARCELRIGKERSRLSMAFYRNKLEENSRERIGLVERLLSAQEDATTREGALELAALRQAPIESAGGLLVKDYVELLARDWAARTSASLHGVVPVRCTLIVNLRGVPAASGKLTLEA